MWHISWIWPPHSNSGKWRFSSGFPTKNVIILVVTGILWGGHTQHISHNLQPFCPFPTVQLDPLHQKSPFFFGVSEPQPPTHQQPPCCHWQGQRRDAVKAGYTVSWGNFLVLVVVVSTHLKNMLLKLDHFPKDRGENKKYLKPPPSFCFWWSLAPEDTLHSLKTPLDFGGCFRAHENTDG